MGDNDDILIGDPSAVIELQNKSICTGETEVEFRCLIRDDGRGLSTTNNLQQHLIIPGSFTVEALFGKIAAMFNIEPNSFTLKLEKGQSVNSRSLAVDNL
jgi:hypothetical protein